MNEECKGIVIQVREYRENDAMLHVLCENGNILSLSAKGIQKIKSKNASACQLFSCSRFLFNIHENSTIQSLRSAEIVESYRKIREDLYKQSIAAYLCECIDASAFEYNVYPLLKEALDILQQSDDPLLILCLFQSLINRMHGIEPFVDGCVCCGREDHIQSISIIRGGFVCKSCYQVAEDRIKSVQELKRFRLLCKAELKHYDILKDYPDFVFSDFISLYDFFAEYAGVSLRSCRFLKHLYNMEEDLK